MTPIRPRALTLVALLLLLPSAVSAQDSRIGDSRVRVRDPFRRSTLFEGRLIGLAGDTAVVATGDSVARILLGAGTREVEVSRGIRRQALRGFGLGLLAGAGGALLVQGIWKVYSDVGTPDGFKSEHRGGNVATTVALAGGAGALIGGLIGAATRYESWERVKPGRVTVTVVPSTARGVQVAARIGF